MTTVELPVLLGRSSQDRTSQGERGPASRVNRFPIEPDISLSRSGHSGHRGYVISRVHDVAPHPLVSRRDEASHAQSPPVGVGAMWPRPPAGQSRYSFGHLPRGGRSKSSRTEDAASLLLTFGNLPTSLQASALAMLVYQLLNS